MNDTIPLGSHLHKPTGEVFQAFRLPQHLAERGSPIDRNGNKIAGETRQDHRAENPFRTWTGNHSQFLECFEKL